MSSAEEKPAPIIFGDEDLSDVTLVVDNQDFKTHKMVLALHSAVFKAMFYGNFKESKEDRVEIKDVSVKNFNRLLEFIYTGKVSDSRDFLKFPTNGYEHFSVYTEYEYIYWDMADSFDHFAPYKKFFHNFWNDATEFVNIADRFNVTPTVKDYLGSTMKFCKGKKCHVCFNYFVFAIFNGMDLSKCKKAFPKSVYMEWLEYATEKPLPEAIPAKVIKTIMKQLS